MSKYTLLAAGAVGFVLGSKAGRGPYESLAAKAGEVRRDPRVQQKVAEAQQVAADKTKEAASVVGDKVSEKVEDVRSGSGTASSTETVGDSGAGPQGDLP